MCAFPPRRQPNPVSGRDEIRAPVDQATLLEPRHGARHRHPVHLRMPELDAHVASRQTVAPFRPCLPAAPPLARHVPSFSSCGDHHPPASLSPSVTQAPSSQPNAVRLDLTPPSPATRKVSHAAAPLPSRKARARKPRSPEAPEAPRHPGGRLQPRRLVTNVTSSRAREAFTRARARTVGRRIQGRGAQYDRTAGGAEAR